MRIRNVKPEFYRSDDIDALTWEQRFLFIALFTYVDDNGVGRDRESDICADLLAGDFSVSPGETLGRVRQCLLALVQQGLIVRYKADDKSYLFITGWDEHQYVKNPNRERYPRPDKALLTSSVDAGETLGRGSVTATPDLPPVVGSKSLVVGSESQVVPPTEEKRGKRASALPSDWIPSERSRHLILDECPGVDLAAEHRMFTDWATSTGKVMKDWDASWRNWMRRSAKGTHGRVRPLSRSQAQLEENTAAWDAWAAEDDHDTRKAIGQ